MDRRSEPRGWQSVCIVALGLMALTLVAISGVSASPVSGEAGPSGAFDAQHESEAVQDQLVVFDDHVKECATTPPADHASPAGGTAETIGYVDGVWYNQSLDFEGETLTEAEMELLTLRTAARVETLRCLAFESVPTTQFLTSDEYRENITDSFEEITDAEAQFYNAQYATLLLVGQERDAVEVEIENRAGSALAFYNFEEKFMGFVTDDPSEIRVDQEILAHELLHALQDQHGFNLTEPFVAPTTDDHGSSLAIYEGDAVLVQDKYDENCRLGEWVDDCFRYQPDLPDLASYGLYLQSFFAYSAPLVEHVYETEGMEGVNSIYDELPQSSVEVIYPELYGEFERTDVDIPDLSNDQWDRIELESNDYDVLGQHTLTSILMAPGLETEYVTTIIDPFEFILFDEETDEVSLDYGHSATEGWQGDKFYAYTSEDELGGVWEIQWENADEMNTFADAFEDLIGYREGNLAAEYDNVFTFEDSNEYDMALGLERQGDTLVVVTAPTIDDLTGVHGDFQLQADSEPADDTDVADGVADADDAADADADDTDDADDADDDGPGFGVLVGILALLATALAIRLHHERGDLAQ